MDSSSFLDKFYVCTLYQISEEKGYLDKDSVYNGGRPVSVLKLLKYREDIIEIREIIVRKNNVFGYKLREIITNIPIDTLYEQSNGAVYPVYERYSLRGVRDKYHTFIVIPLRSCHPTLYELNEYCDKYQNSKEYREELLELLNKGKKFYSLKKQEDISNLMTVKKRIKILNANSKFK